MAKDWSKEIKNQSSTSPFRINAGVDASDAQITNARGLQY